MAVAESRKRANAKWDKENMTTLGCKIKRTQAAAFKAYCENQGSTSNTVLKDFVLGCIGEQEAAPQAGEGSPGIPLSPEALKTAQEAAESTGETVPQFIGRAVQTQAQQDKASLSLGIDPATGRRIGKE
ncbi:MAG: hypothetical protein ACLURW_15535 [Flavonifractor plautii]